MGLTTNYYETLMFTSCSKQSLHWKPIILSGFLAAFAGCKDTVRATEADEGIQVLRERVHELESQLIVLRADLDMAEHARKASEAMSHQAAEVDREHQSREFIEMQNYLTKQWKTTVETNAAIEKNIQTLHKEVQGLRADMLVIGLYSMKVANFIFDMAKTDGLAASLIRHSLPVSNDPTANEFAQDLLDRTKETLDSASDSQKKLVDDLKANIRRSNHEAP